MRKNGYKRRWLCGILALISGFILPGAVQANSGGAVTNIGSTSYYVGTKGDSGNEVIINNDWDAGVIGGYAKSGSGSAEASNNGVTVRGGVVKGNVYGGYADSNAGSTASSNNRVTVNAGNIIGSIYGGDAFTAFTSGNATANSNIVTVSGSNEISIVYGGNAWSGINYGKAEAGENKVMVNNSTITIGIYGGKAGGASCSALAVASQNCVTVSGDSNIKGDIYGGYAQGASANNVASQNNVTINGGRIECNIYGGEAYSGTGSVTVSDNRVTVSGGTVTGDIYGGYVANGNGFSNKNIVTLSGTADVNGADLYGSNLENTVTEGNALVIDGWQGTVKSVNNFDSIDFQNLNWKNQETVLAIGDADGSSLADTDIHLISMAGGQKIQAGEYMYIIKSDGTLNTNPDKITVEENFTAGVAIDGTGEVSRDDQGNIKFEVTGTSVSDQINLVAENQAVAAAFVNQGTDLISDGLDAMNRDGNYGIKTFAAVHGNRSQYDVNSDLKINGWSTLVGIGNEKKIGSGDFSWGIFYENGSGNYRTYNKFNNGFFRGDGSLLYNGGGIAARLDREDGLYIEGSLRAGTLKSDMSNALKDGAGNSYGYESESTYYGVHVGMGKIFRVNETTDVDVYGKFFHTYTEGDSFAVAGDVFEFDKVTSNRLRIGSRVTANQEDRLSLYCGLAWEYEFSGDAHMKAQGMSVPEQSLQGSSYMAEVGMHYKPGTASPWRFDLNVRGYAGQREGISFSAQAGYTF